MDTPNVDFIVETGAKRLRKSDMSPDQWKALYPVSRMMINNFIYTLMSSDIQNVQVIWQGNEMAIRTKPQWGAYRLFCHHNGAAYMDQGPGQRTGTSFGVIYLERKIIHLFTFRVDGRFEMKTEAYTDAKLLV